MEHTLLNIGYIGNIRLNYKSFVHHKDNFSNCKYTKNNWYLREIYATTYRSNH